MAWPRIRDSYIKLPIGIVLALCPLYGIDKLIKLSPVSIPASVVCMLILFLGLLLLERILGTKKVSTIVSWVNVPSSFMLRWMNVFFTPSFTLLPLATPVSVAEAFEIAAVFVFGYFVLMAAVAYLVWGLQKLSGTRRRPYSSNSEDTTNEIELPSQAAAASSSIVQQTPAETEAVRIESSADPTSVPPSPTMTPPPPPPSPPTAMHEPAPTASINRPHNPGVSLQQNERYRNCVQSRPQQTREELSDRARMIGSVIAANWDWIMYSTLFMVGLPIYFVLDYAMPLHLAIIMLLFLGCMQIPQKYRQYLHPIIISGSSAILFIYVFGLAHNESLQTSLQYYKTGRNYLYLFDQSPKYQNQLPGAGDVLSSLLDVSIVALAMPMYNYRTDLKRHFFMLAVPCTVSGLACFFIYPPLSYALGVQNTRSMAFMARSVTLALALPIVQAVDGSTSMISVVAILSGIMGVLFGGAILGKRGLRIRQDDYVTRGITLGINSSAVASAYLLPVDPRAAALSSLSFFLYGIVMVVLSAITPLANAVRSWVDLPAVG